MKIFLRILLVLLTLSFFMASCFHLPELTALIRPKPAGSSILLKYPVILVHGIMTYDREAGRHIFWGRIPYVLEENGVKVFFGGTDAWGSFESNAEKLLTTIETVLRVTNSEKVNIIAHSKGGLDSRYLIWKYDFGDKVASLTTVSTPHRGAEIADMIFRREFIHSDITREALKVFGELFGDTNPDVYGVNYFLTTEKMEEFNKQVIMDPRVFFQSLYTTIDSTFNDLVMVPSYWYLKVVTGENDGIVSEHSARWGDNPKKIGTGISHAEIIDIKRRKKISGVEIPDIYIGIVRDLGARGF